MLRLRFDDSTRATRSHTLEHATDRTETILAAARDLLASAMPMIARNGITLIGVAVANLDDDAAVQLSLPFKKSSGTELDVAVDDVRRRFGSKAVTRAVLLDRDEGIQVPLLPD
jgi:DNA polymerase-4